ncbi:DUF3099 domain-containing protein [Arthrobacter rhombi]|uniref:DUF3099 domain-containing protein n=1 Tax=Arthrobacter rhombi TaxID=71253 RepID=UPI003F90900D
MSQHSHPLNQPVPAGHPQRITDADESRSADRHSRTVKYTISMSVRMACFITAFFVHGWIQVVMLILAVVLPYFAVVVANASGADLAKRTETNYYEGGPGEPAMLDGAPAATVGDDDAQQPSAEDRRETPDGSVDVDEPYLLSGHWYDPEADADEPPEDPPRRNHHSRSGNEREHG